MEFSDNCTITLQIPAWRPGRYELQNYAKHITHFRAVDEGSNNLLWQKTERNLWQIEKGKGAKAIVNYSYYASQMDAGGSWLDDSQLYINPINCLMYAACWEHKPHKLSLSLPEGYKIACGLEEIASHTLISDNYFHLADSPMMASKYIQHHFFEVKQIPFSIWIQGDCNPDWGKIESDFRKFIACQLTVFGSFPERQYHFLIQILPYPHFHGVEHRNSTLITLGPAKDFAKEEFYNKLLGIACHELFHTWNICKIRPVEMLPYNLSKETYFPTGFVVEGITTYYGDVLLMRAAVWNLDTFFKSLDENIQRHFSNPARHRVSLAQASLDLWVDGYQQTHPDRKISIYDKGAIAALVLDLEIRRMTENRKSLDDVMRALWNNFGQKNIGYSIVDFVQICELEVGGSLTGYFEDCIFGTTPLERILAKGLDYIGCVLHLQHPADMIVWKYGLKLAKQAGKWVIEGLEPGSPAEKTLTLRDEIVSINGYTQREDWQQLYDKQMLSVSIIRIGIPLVKNLLADGGNYFPRYSVRRNKCNTEAQANNLRLWSGM